MMGVFFAAVRRSAASKTAFGSTFQVPNRSNGSRRGWEKTRQTRGTGLPVKGPTVSGGTKRCPGSLTLPGILE